MYLPKLQVLCLESLKNSKQKFNLSIDENTTQMTNLDEMMEVCKQDVINQEKICEKRHKIQRIITNKSRNTFFILYNLYS